MYVTKLLSNFYSLTAVFFAKSWSDSNFPENAVPLIFGTNFASCLGILTIEGRKVQVFIDTNFLRKKTFCFY
jgi:hypothetical protein